MPRQDCGIKRAGQVDELTLISNLLQFSSQLLNRYRSLLKQDILLARALVKLVNVALFCEASLLQGNLIGEQYAVGHNLHVCEVVRFGTGCDTESGHSLSNNFARVAKENTVANRRAHAGRSSPRQQHRGDT